MQKQTWILVGLLLAAPYLFSQSMQQMVRNTNMYIPGADKIDSLKKAALNGADDSSQVKRLCLLSTCYFQLKNDSALLFSRQALQVASKINDPYALMMAWRWQAADYYTFKDYDQAVTCFQKGLDICIRENFYREQLFDFRPAMNNIFFLRGNHTAAMEMSADGLALAEKLNNRERMAHFNGVLGFILLKQGNFEDAQRYYTAYLSLTRELNDKYQEGNALINLADLSLAQQKLPAAAGYVAQAIRIFEHDNIGNHDNVERQAYAYNKMAGVYKLMKKGKTALQYSLRAINITDTVVCNLYDVASYYINAGDIYNLLGAPDSALVFLRNGFAVAKSIMHREYMRDAFQQFSVAFAAKKMFDSAYGYQQQFLLLRDSIDSEINQRAILQKEASLTIEKQKQLQESALIQQRTWRNIIIGIAIFLIAIIVLMYNRARLKQRYKMQAEQSRRQEEILFTTINVQDKERKRVAEDLHDGLGSLLSVAKLKLSAIENVPGAGDKDLLTVQALLDEALMEMKNIAYNMMPATLSRLGLTAALQNLFNRIGNQSGLNINFSTHSFAERLDEETELSIYRIVLEAVNNVVKHAQAKAITVQLLRYPDHINVMVEDDGIGFNRETTTFAGNGLSNIAARVKKLRGTLDIDSRPGAGTTIIADIPYPLLP